MRIENVFFSDKNELKINDKWYFEKKFIRNSVRKGDKLMMMVEQSDSVIRLILFDLKLTLDIGTWRVSIQESSQLNHIQ